jgi:hypothetical protein
MDTEWEGWNGFRTEQNPERHSKGGTGLCTKGEFDKELAYRTGKKA